ncbi:unnamed protein product [Linum tenue]|uniref:Secreted protein n=1 Tax=Linum tenue TaxID=586396 RepID=A0AAV0IXD5_9ROSI|nr:unnamed protein product [Linum tenue]
MNCWVHFCQLWFIGVIQGYIASWSGSRVIGCTQSRMRTRRIWSPNGLSSKAFSANKLFKLLLPPSCLR